MCPELLEENVVCSPQTTEFIIRTALFRNRDYIRVCYGWNPDADMTPVYEALSETLEENGIRCDDDIKSKIENYLYRYRPNYEEDVGYWNSLSTKDVQRIARKTKDQWLKMVDYIIVRTYSLLDDYSWKMLGPIDYGLFMNHLLIELRDCEDNHQFSYNGQFIVHNLDTIVKKVSEAVSADRHREVVFRGKWDKTVVPNYSPEWKILLESNRFRL